MLSVQSEWAEKNNTTSSETSHHSTRREDPHSRLHYLSYFQRNLCFTPLLRLYVSDRLHLRGYHNSTIHNSRTPTHVLFSAFHTKRLNYALQTMSKEESTIMFSILWIKLHQGSGNIACFCYNNVSFFFLSFTVSTEKIPCGVQDKNSFVCIQCLSLNCSVCHCS